MSNKTEQLEKAYSEATIALGEGCIAMDRLVDLVNKGLPIEDFQLFMEAMSHHHAKLLKGVK
tara:strand:- start:36 stop:221 length:186 start_codon:yes stop_codon:yes gene_type:complete